MPCFCSKRSILEMEFFDIWNDGDINTVREELINKKQFYGCKYCEQFYKSNFLVVEDNIVKYKNNKFHFENTLNPILSAPFVGIIKKDNICIPVPLFDDNQIQELHKNENLVLILK